MRFADLLLSFVAMTYTLPRRTLQSRAPQSTSFNAKLQFERVRSPLRDPVTRERWHVDCL